MAERVTNQEVEEIFDNSDSLPIKAFIVGANLIVTKNLTGAGAGLSAAELKEIERWLAAYMVAMRTRQEESVKVETGQATFTGTYGMGLDSTQYGQMVKVLDRSGILASLGMRQAKFSVVQEGELP